MESLTQLRNELATLKANEPKLRNRQLAQRLGISEVELLTLSLNEDVIRLDGDWKVLLASLKPLGKLMALTRNEACVHERKGVYDNATFYKGPHNMGVFVNPDIDLRLFMNEWHYGLFVRMHRGKNKTLLSFQFFNARGEAVHKVFSTPKTDKEAFLKLVEDYVAEQTPIIVEDRTPPAKPAEKPDEDIAIQNFQQDWINLQDTHHFFGMLKKYELSRTQAFRLAPEGMVTPVDRLIVSKVLEAAAQADMSIMCFVGSSGCIQIHTGPIKRLLWHGSWFNVMDPDFNLHLDTTAIHNCYVVRKPTEDGQVTSLELFDANGELIVYFFGKRKPGQSEMNEWRELLEGLPSLNEVPA